MRPFLIQDLSPVALVVCCIFGFSGVGFFFAFYAFLYAKDQAEIDEYLRDHPLGRYGENYFNRLRITGNWTPAYLVARHWRERPQVRQMLALAILFLSVVAITLAVDGHFR